MAHTRKHSRLSLLLLALLLVLAVAALLSSAVPGALGATAKPPLPKGARQSAVKERMKESAAFHEFNGSPKIGGGSPVIETKFGGPINPQKPPKEQKPAKAVPERQRLPGNADHIIHGTSPAAAAAPQKKSKMDQIKECVGACTRKAVSGLKSAAKASVSAAGKVLKVAGTVAMGPGSYAEKRRKKR
ncbi:hypothetical protein DFJ73DRAFT_759400 [Zopfochytrium polystomum]|nr:hypothetical protein DFJ73DRAFT_759400 [Zopfochytrium polystomum]